MNSEQFRTVTGTSCVPTGTVGTGTIAPHPTQANMLVGTGTQFTVDFKSVYQLYKQNIWIYAVNANLVARVTGVMTDELLVVDTGNMVGVAAGDTFQVILADIISWGIVNNGGATGQVAGQSLEDGESVSQDPIILTPNHFPRHLDAVTLDATGTSFVISEVR